MRSCVFSLPTEYNRCAILEHVVGTVIGEWLFDQKLAVITKVVRKGDDNRVLVAVIQVHEYGFTKGALTRISALCRVRKSRRGKLTACCTVSETLPKLG